MAGGTIDFFSSKHKKLLWISTWANILAWIALIVYALITLSTILDIRYDLLSLPQFLGSSEQGQLGVVTEYLAIGVKLITRVLEACFPGIVYWLILKGISVGLKMTVETDINYREICKEEASSSLAQEQAGDIPLEEPAGDENVPVFYEPQEVSKIEDRLSWLAIVAVFVIIITNIPQFAYVEAVIRTYWFDGQALGYLSWLITIFIVVLGIAVEFLIAYFAIKALASILNILMEMEYNSRGVTE
jgi:hypothetical protein